MSTPSRLAHTLSWSTAAARNVSAAATMTFLPIWSLSSQHSLAMLVVFPAPLMPATRITVGPDSASRSSRWSADAHPRTISSRTTRSASSAFLILPSRHRSRTAATSRSTFATPMSAWRNLSSISVRNASLICRPGTNSVRTSVFSTATVFLNAPRTLSSVLWKKAMGGQSE